METIWLIDSILWNWIKVIEQWWLNTKWTPLNSPIEQFATRAGGDSTKVVTKETNKGAIYRPKKDNNSENGQAPFGNGTTWNSKDN